MSQSRATVAVTSSSATTTTTTTGAETVANNANDVVVIDANDDAAAGVAARQRNAVHDMETINLLDDDDDDDDDEDDEAVIELSALNTRVPENMNSSSQGSQIAATTTTTIDLCDTRRAERGNNANDHDDVVVVGGEDGAGEMPTCSFDRCRVQKQQQQQGRSSNLKQTSSVNTTSSSISSSSSSSTGTSSSSNSSSRHPSDEIITVNDDDDDDNVSSTSAAGAAALIATDPAAATQSSANTSSAAANAAAVLECPICLLTCVHPTRLPCGHIFCYLCVKGVANKNHRCAMCRRNIPTEFLEHPQLVNGTDDINMTKATDDGYQWFYEGRNGWWQYDDRTSQDIEDAYKKGEKSCTILVAGYVYIVDLEAMLQQRQNEPTRCRRVKRDLATIPKKGVAGLRIEGGNIVTAETSSSSSSSSGSGNNSHHVLTHMHHTLMPLEYIDDDVGVDASGRSSHAQNISTIAATDAAIRIASDIIGSTLAHADELIRRRNSMPTLASDIVAANSSVGGLYGEQNIMPMAFSLGDSLRGGMPLPRDEMPTMASMPRTSTHDRRRAFDFYESTLNDFRDYNLENMIDSSEEDDDEDTHILDIGISLSELLLGPNHGRQAPETRTDVARQAEQLSAQESAAAPSAGESSNTTTSTANSPSTTTNNVIPNRQLRF